MSDLSENSASYVGGAAVLGMLQALCACDHAHHLALTLNSVETKQKYYSINHLRIFIIEFNGL